MFALLLAGLEAFLAKTLLPILLDEAEKAFSRGDADHVEQKSNFLQEAVDEFIDDFLAPKLPSFLQGDVAQIKKMADTAVAAAIAKIQP